MRNLLSNARATFVVLVVSLCTIIYVNYTLLNQISQEQVNIFNLQAKQNTTNYAILNWSIRTYHYAAKHTGLVLACTECWEIHDRQGDNRFSRCPPLSADIIPEDERLDSK